MKSCSKCKLAKPTTEFSKNISSRDGLCSSCKSCRSLAHAAWRAANPDKAKANMNKWVANNREKHNASTVAWRKDNPWKQKECSAKWRLANPERQKAATAAWCAANPEAKRVHDQNRRSRKLANGGRLSPGIADRLFKLQRGKCACCHASIEDGNHIDHVIPLALGGPNEDWNVQLLCQACNRSKGAKHPVEFMQSRGFLL